MKANELRIRNYVLLDKKITEVYTIDEDGINEDVDCDFESFKHDGYFNIDGRKLQFKESVLIKIKPIPLKEDWLVKFKYRYNKKGKYWISPNGFKLWNSGTKKKPYFYHLNDELLINIDHVHHLQNVEFILTGEELQAKS